MGVDTALHKVESPRGVPVPSIYRIEQLFVDERVLETPLAQRVLERWDGAQPPRMVRDVAGLVEQARHQPDPLTRGKRSLLITLRQGPFLTACQGMTDRHVACCGYAVLNVAQNCPMDCSYCILQHYLDNPLLVVYANLDGLRDEIARARLTGLSASLPKPETQNSKLETQNSKLETRNRPPGRLLRLGTGELSDSLAADHLTGLSLEIMRAVEPFDDVIVELKTKAVEIENLLSVAAPPNVVVSWSLNTPRHIAGEEIGAPALEDRLAAAARCRQHGYMVAFHFDPLIASPGWEREYPAVVEALFDRLDSARIAYISLGALRYPAAMKRTIEERFSQSAITAGELVRSWDGKLRYFRPIRVALYRRMVEWIEARSPQTAVYLCMESPQVWMDVFGWKPAAVEDVAERLDAGCRKAKLAGRAVRAAAGGA